MPVDTPFLGDSAALESAPQNGAAQESSAAAGSSDRACSGPVSAGLSDAVLRAIANDATSDAVAVALVNRMTAEFSVQRVSLGISRSGSTRLKAVSDQMKLDIRRSIPQLLQSVLGETFDADSPICFNSSNVSDLTPSYPAHAELNKTQTSKSAWSFAVDGKQFRYAVLMESDRDMRLKAPMLELMQNTIAPSIALLDVLVQQEQTFFQTLRQRATGFVNDLSRGNLSGRPCLALAMAGLLAVSFVVPVTAKVSSRASIVAADSQMIVAPENGFVQSSSVRAGDSVKAGDLLATLDNRDIRLTADKWHSEANKNLQSQAQALASRDRIELGRLRADMARIEAELALVDRQLQRAELRAPFDGVVTQGDLTQSLGAAVAHGETLFTVARTDEYRLELDVDEHDIALVNPGQTLRLRLSSAPGQGLSATIQELLPVARSEAGVSTFRVQAELVDPPLFLRPGMEGIAKINIGSRSAISVYTRKLRNGLRLWAWKLGLL